MNLKAYDAVGSRRLTGEYESVSKDNATKLAESRARAR
jgi:hypothetical protein